MSTILQQLQETNAKLAQQNAELQNALIQLQNIVQKMGNAPNESNKTTLIANKLMPDKI